MDETYARKGIETVASPELPVSISDETYARKGIETVAEGAATGLSEMRLTPGRALKPEAAPTEHAENQDETYARKGIET